MLARGRALRQHFVSARQVLGLQDGQSCTPAEIKRAFRERALAAHPDAGGDPDSFRRLQAAYEALLQERGAGKKGSKASAASESGGGGGGASGFYAHPHAQWSNDMRSHRAYWHDMYAGTNSNNYGSHQRASETHGSTSSHYRTYGDGLGEEFQQAFKSSSAGYGQGSRQTNFSTWHFYRPYDSDYRNPYTTGFTSEEIHQAAQRQRRVFARAVVRHAFLWSGLAFVVYLHERNNRVWRAVEARGKGYQDPEYWAQLRKDEEEARRRSRAPLRLEHHWLETPLAKPFVAEPAESDRNGCCGENVHGTVNSLSGAARVGKTRTSQQSRAAEERRRRAIGSSCGALRGLGRSFGGPRVASYQGRPFTPNGVRGVRNTAPMTPKTYADDVTYEMGDEEDDL
ncbi:hypothetical protein LSCM1_04477 [Leishmania martiniquensis]|uniref:J domain-containing protein n=1 Tax=Leishmania martiniquensis TaxID=1580590 RepID=A0A836HBH8_9TRYP|nr:hypothetical protein LSCM1_04477 [Leishmania martiniquensis]